VSARWWNGSSATRPPRSPRRRASRPLLRTPAALLAEAHLLGELRARRSVARRDHRIVGGKAPLLAVLLRRHVVLRAQGTLQRLELFAVLETDQIVGGDRLLHRDGRLQRLRLGVALAA